jgi:hypothetical protein
MKTKKIIVGLFLIVTPVMFLTHSCSKDSSGTMSSSDLALAQDQAYADALYQEVDNTVMADVSAMDANQYSGMALKSGGDDGDCAVITVDHPDTASFPKVITLDYGDGCTKIFRNDTITRKGKIIISLDSRWFETGSKHTVTFDGFYINNVKIEGTRTITNLGLNAKNNLELGILLQNGKITFNDTAFITRDANHVREWIRHNDPLNDSILITGTASGINIGGEQYEHVITSPLILIHCPDYHWRWVVAGGTVQITNSASGTTTLDYTGAGCDGTVIVGKNGFHHNYLFMYRHHNHHHN